MVIRLERERQRAAMDERERANKRMQKRIEAEQKALDEEKKKRGLGKKEDRSSKQVRSVQVCFICLFVYLFYVFT